MKVLVLVAAYPTPEGGVGMYYVHTRNKYYVRNGIDVTVINCNCKAEYALDGVKVIPLNTYVESNEEWDYLICHAANLRNHYWFLKKYGKRFKKFVFFFHGHEVLRYSKVYSKPFDFQKKNHLKIFLKDIYDFLKLRIWHTYYLKYIEKSTLVFVSNWMLDEFIKWVKIDKTQIEGHYHVIYNCIGKEFEEESFEANSAKKYDFITIRSVLDQSKYGIDLVNKWAKANPNYKFCVVGKGSIFNYYSKADNIEWIDNYMNHQEITGLLNQSRCALMPTRTDAQGVMVCEMATFGIPVITSDIPVCEEVFSGFKNVKLLSNASSGEDLKGYFEELINSDMNLCKNEKYFEKNTSGREVELLKSI